MANFANGEFCKWHNLQMANFANGEFCKWRILQMVNLANGKFGNWQMQLVNLESGKFCNCQITQLANLANRGFSKWKIANLANGDFQTSKYSKLNRVAGAYRLNRVQACSKLAHMCERVMARYSHAWQDKWAALLLQATSTYTASCFWRDGICALFKK